MSRNNIIFGSDSLNDKSLNDLSDYYESDPIITRVQVLIRKEEFRMLYKYAKETKIFIQI